ncbi:MAG: aspartate kinase [Rickettsiaceae bacterium]
MGNISNSNNMSLIVQKFGGTSLEGIDRINAVSDIIISSLQKYDQLVVVVSAIAGDTNNLISLCSAISSLNNSDNHEEALLEIDSVLSSGEVVSAGLLALALQRKGVKARSILAWQLPILAYENQYGQARVLDVNDSLIKQCLSDKVVPVIAGFQAINSESRIVTLGRGGSDITAALIAAKINANLCEIYTDVDGLFSGDPRLIVNAKKIDQISFEEMLELSTSGAKVLHSRCVEIAMRHNISIKILSSFDPKSTYTLITKYKKDIMEDSIVKAITYNKNLLEVIIQDSNVINIIELLNRNQVHIELLVCNEKNKFIAQLIDKSRLEQLFLQNNISADFNDHIAAIAIIGCGFKNNHDVLIHITDILKFNNIDVFLLQITENKISMIIHDSQAEEVTKLLHNKLL